MIKLMGLESCYTQMVMFTKGSGMRTWLMGRASTSMQTAQSTMGPGTRISRKALERRSGQMGQGMRGTSRTA